MIRKAFALIYLLASLSLSLSAQQKTENLILITLDGLRWQELFQGADAALLFDKNYVNDRTTVKQFWAESPQLRREALMPFFWNVIGKAGQLYGNREYNNQVNCANPHWFSYPGYSEMLVGFVDRRIKSNHKIENPNYTVLEYIYQQPGFKGRVAAFSTWDVMPFILREATSGIPVNGGSERAAGDSLRAQEVLLNELQDILKNPYGERYDAFTFYYAFEYLKREKPRVMFISFDETDAHGHGGRYDEYLKAAHQTDKMIERLWNWIQNDEDYKDKTTLLITTDHGRGKGKRNSWKNHGRLSAGSSQIWFAAVGPDTPALGEMKTNAQYFQQQFAKTAAALLGLDYNNVQPVGEPINSVLLKSMIE